MEEQAEGGIDSLVWGLQTAIGIMDKGTKETEVKMLCSLGDKEIILHFRHATKEEIEESPSGMTVSGYNPLGDLID